MKYIILILLFYSFSSSQVLPGGRPDRYENKSSANETDDRAYLSLGLNLLEINSHQGAEGMLSFGVIKKSNLILGGGIYAVLFDSFKVDEFNNTYIRYTNGFFNLGYYIKIHKNIKLSPVFLIGAGRVNLTNNALGIFSDPNGDWYTFIEPSLDLDIRIWQKAHLGLGVSYRKSFGIQKYELNNDDFTSLCFKFYYKMIIE